jgi:hypothetical protein
MDRLSFNKNLELCAICLKIAYPSAKALSFARYALSVKIAYPLTKALSFTPYAFSFQKHPIQDPVRIYI